MSKLLGLIVIAFRFLCDFEIFIDKQRAKYGWAKKSFSQKKQDLWVIEDILPGVRGGYFVEIGGGDGRTHSNSYILERDYEWSGVIVEANQQYCTQIKNLRKCECINACVDGDVKKVNFLPAGYLGGIIAEDTDYTMRLRAWFIKRNSANVQILQTRTLVDILDEINAPNVIDYLSIDVEGAELRILGDFDFEKYSFLSMTIERPSGELHKTLINNGYVLHKTYLYDGFYVSKDIAEKRNIKGCHSEGVRTKFF